MKFKDRLKALRIERQLTQKELGEAIFVSRSAIAKWENGLGLPSRDSYEALVRFFDTDTDAFPLNEQEEIEDIKKRVRTHFIMETVSWILILCLAVSPLLLLWAVDNGYGFTSKMAAGEIWEDNKVISTRDYDFYLSTMTRIVDENGEVESCLIDGFCAVEKRFYGYQRLNISDFGRVVLTEDDKPCGILYSFKGKGGNYNIFQSKKTLNLPADLKENYGPVMDITLFSEIFVNGKKIELMHHAYFITEDCIAEFSTSDKVFTVK